MFTGFKMAAWNLSVQRRHQGQHPPFSPGVQVKLSRFFTASTSIFSHILPSGSMFYSIAAVILHFYLSVLTEVLPCPLHSFIYV